MVRPRIEVFPSAEALAKRAADLLLERLGEAVGPFRLVISGGRTPARLFELLGGVRLSEETKSRLHVFWADERCVPPDHPESNYRLAWERWLHRAGLADGQIHRIPAERGEEAAALYEQEIRRHFGLGPRDFPRFDLIFLGLGEDGHTASLFPGCEGLGETSKLAVFARAPIEPSERISLTLPVLNRAREVLFLVSGSRKAATLRRVVVVGPESGLPAALVKPVDGTVLWLVDEEAARYSA